MEQVTVKNKAILDIGCGTGRHWAYLYSRNPSCLYGADVSKGMLNQLQQKFLTAQVYQLEDNKLPFLPDASCDLLISTLAVAHIQQIEDAVKEWSRVLKTTSEIIITDYHPAMLQAGGERTFRYHDKTIGVKSFVYQIDYLRTLLDKYGFKAVYFEECIIDEFVKHYYEQQQALHVYEKYKGTSFLYGLRLKRDNE